MKFISSLIFVIPFLTKTRGRGTDLGKLGLRKIVFFVV